ncbi:MAG TPA: prepilin-type N-terminal cleavage/methylation domain-containing protein [Tepidisphaeraceae bacterium]|jgi:type II secretory pathway pseudopilin PulG|nr:prepilin-type N-terminal cleavage/methylation domain-containing protein [Tepidisphaeraceae bacterium]
MHDVRKPTSSAFTLIELLVVIGIIVLVVLLALPVLNVLQGNRSSDAAQNQLQALINEARMNAIGLQRDGGVMFYIDPSTKRVHTVLVQGTDSQPGDQPNVDVYLDLIRDHESVPLTIGLSLQTIDNASVVPGTPPTRGDDGYIGFNNNDPTNPQTIEYGGVILFDSHGQLVSRTYGFRIGYSPTVWSEMGKLIMLNSSGNPPGPGLVPGQPGPNPPPQSAFGLVLFNAEAFKGQDFHDADTQVGGAGFNNAPSATLPGYAGGPEDLEERWLDQNSIPLIVNRYNGTLIRGE